MSKNRITHTGPCAPNWREVLQDYRGQYKYESQELGINKKTNPERYYQLVRAAYDSVLPELLKQSAKGRTVKLYFMEWDMTHNQYTVFVQIRGASPMMPLYPDFPILHLFASFADPHRRIALFVEEGADTWNAEQNAQEDALLHQHGWWVFRLPHTICNTWKSEVLPEHLRDVEEIGPEDEEQQEEREGWNAELAATTLDGFFDWLSRNIYGWAALKAEREKAPADTHEVPAGYTHRRYVDGAVFDFTTLMPLERVIAEPEKNRWHVVMRLPAWVDSESPAPDEQPTE
jgi:hypothetical protein